MKTCCDPIAWAVIRQPSSSRCGTRCMISRSLKVPGSDSSALTTRYVGLPVPLARKLAFRPIGNPAPPRPRMFAARSSSTIFCGSVLRAFASILYPPALRYAASFVRSRFSAPANSSGLTGIAHLGDDPGHVLWPHRLAIAMVDRDDGRPAAAARALHRAQRDRTIVGRLPGPDAELGLERVQYLLRPDERARDVR